MSLFKTREWWTAEVGDGDVPEDICAVGSLLAAHLSPEEPEATQLVVGSFTGSLNIYSPQVSVTEDGEEVSGYRPDHLLLETTLSYPVLQLLAGTLVGGGTPQQQLLVLHPRRIMVYSVAVTSGRNRSAQAGKQGMQAKLMPAYQHSLSRQAYCAVVGPFGGVRGKDFICVQSLDGCLSIFEQESFAFHVFLPNALLAGPLVFLPKSDAFVTMAAAGTLQCYRYQNLAVSRADDEDASSGGSGGRRLAWDWEYVLGEEAIDMQVVGEAPLLTLLLLTSRGFYAFKETGSLKFVKKLEFNPACFTTYCVGAGVFVCVATHSGIVLLYHETVLKWAAQLPAVPVALTRASLRGIEGGLSLLTGEGRLQVVYLGTDPSLFAAPPIETREINYEDTDKELAQLHKIIKASTKDSSTLLSSERTDAQQLTVAATVGQKLEPWTGLTAVQDPDGPVPCCTAVIRLVALQPINGVRVAICVQKPLQVSQEVFMLRTVSDSSQVLVRFYLSAAYVASSLTAEVVTSYTTARGAPRVIRTLLELPLRLVVKASTPNKEADHKLTISTNKPAVNLPELFPEFGLDSSLSSTGVGLQHYTGPLVTVLSSRTTHRYRLQSDSLAALWVIFREMSRRLISYWGTGGRQGKDEQPVTLSVSSTLPLNELYTLIDAHFLRRKKLASLNEQLVQRCMQVRAVQRRLLTKFKDKNPTPLTNLDNLLDGMYKQVLHITDLIQDNTGALEMCGAQLACVVQLVVELLRLHHRPAHHELFAAALTHHLPPPHQSQGWEEVVDCCVSHLLRTVMGNEGQQGGGAPPPLSQPQDTNKLKKHISLLLDKMTKGGLNKAQQDVMDDNIDGEESSSASASAAEDHVEVPLGSRLGEDRVRSARIRSARQLSARSRRPLLRSPSGQEEETESVYEETDDRPQILVEEEEEERDGNEVEEEQEETPYQAAIEELDNMQMEEDQQVKNGASDDDASSKGDADDGDGNSVTGDVEEGVEVLSEVNDADEDEPLEDTAKDEATKLERPLKSAKGLEGPTIESPAVDIFGNPEQDEDAW